MSLLENNLAGMKILVIGGNGFIGSHLIKRLQTVDSEIYSLGLNLPHSPPGNVKFLQADITQPMELQQLLSPHQFDYIFNLAGYINHSPYLDDGRTVINTHLIGVMNLVNVLWWKGLKKFIQIGSSDEYGGAPSPQSETFRERPISPYSLAKTASTHFIQMLSHTENFPGVVLRFFLVYGPNQDDKRFLPQVIKKSLADQIFPVSEGQQIRDFCYIEDVVDGIIMAAVKKEACGQVLNIASGVPITIRETLEKVTTLIGKGKPQFGFIPYRTGENMSLYANINLAKKILGWQPKISLEQGLEKTIFSYAKQLEKLL